MTASEQITKRKFSLMLLAEELGNVSKPCQLMGYYRDWFYEIKRPSPRRTTPMTACRRSTAPR